MRKFSFDTEFAPDGTIVRDGSQTARRFNSDEVETARQAAYAQGRDDALAAAERASAQALADLAARTAALLQTLDVQAQAMRAQATQLALVAARKIADAALDAFGHERVMAAIETAMENLRHSPRLIVRIAPDAAETLRPRIAEMAAAHQYPNAVIVRAEAGLQGPAVTIDWGDGVVTLDPNEIAARIDAQISSALLGAAQGEHS